MTVYKNASSVYVSRFIIVKMLNLYFMLKYNKLSIHKCYPYEAFIKYDQLEILKYNFMNLKAITYCLKKKKTDESIIPKRIKKKC